MFPLCFWQMSTEIFPLSVSGRFLRNADISSVGGTAAHESGQRGGTRQQPLVGWVPGQGLLHHRQGAHVLAHAPHLWSADQVTRCERDSVTRCIRYSLIRCRRDPVTRREIPSLGIRQLPSLEVRAVKSLDVGETQSLHVNEIQSLDVIETRSQNVRVIPPCKVRETLFKQAFLIPSFYQINTPHKMLLEHKLFLLYFYKPYYKYLL